MADDGDTAIGMLREHKEVEDRVTILRDALKKAMKAHVAALAATGRQPDDEADETNPEAVATYGQVNLPVVVPNDPATDVASARLGRSVLEAVTPLAQSLRLSS